MVFLAVMVFSGLLGCDCDPMSTGGLVLPGTSMLGMGFDILTGQLPVASQRVVQLTYQLEKTQQNPLNLSVIWEVADQFTVTSQTGSDTTFQSQVSYSAAEFASSKMAGIDIPVPLPNAFALNVGVQTAHETLSKRSQYSGYTISTFDVWIYHVSLPSSFSLNSTTYFQESVAQLPALYDPATDTAYKNFIKQFGTHYVVAGWFGGQGVQQIAVNVDFGSEYTSSTLSTQASLHAGYTAQMTTVDSQTAFMQSAHVNSSSSSHMVGGNQAYAGSLINWEDWVNSFYEQPALISSPGHVVVYGNYTDFIANKTIAANVNSAIQAYFQNNPYPAGPPCQEALQCPGSDASACCGLGQSCCPDGCYTNFNDNCCDSGYACNQGDACCGEGCCEISSATCCSDGCYTGAYDQCCSDGSACGHGETCCECGGGGYCCAGGHGCLCVFGIGGCNPLFLEDVVLNTMDDVDHYINGSNLSSDEFIAKSHINYKTRAKKAQSKARNAPVQSFMSVLKVV